MKIVNLEKEVLEHETELAAFTIERLSDTRRLGRSAEYTRFLFSADSFHLTANGASYGLDRMTAVKIKPGTEAVVAFNPKTNVYLLELLRGEQDYLDALQQKHQEFFERLLGSEERVADEWREVKDEDLDYIIPGERNAEKILRKNGVVIAPDDSRFKPDSPSGWLLMYARASRAVGIGSDDIKEIRRPEDTHHGRGEELHYQMILDLNLPKR